MRKIIGRFFREMWQGHLKMLEIKSSIYSGISVNKM